MAMEVEGQWLSAHSFFSFFTDYSVLFLILSGNIPNLSPKTAESRVFHTWLGLFFPKYLWNSTICHLFLQLLLFVQGVPIVSL